MSMANVQALEDNMVETIGDAMMGASSIVEAETEAKSEGEVHTFETAAFTFDDDFQAKIAALAIRDQRFVRRTEGLINPAHFENEARAIVVAIVQDYYRKYRRVPSDNAVFAQVLKDGLAEKKVRKDLVQDIVNEVKALRKIKLDDADYVAEKVGEFARHQAIQFAFLESMELTEKGRYDEAQRIMEKAFRVGVIDDFQDIDYWNDIERRTQYRKDKAAGLIKPDGITTGIKKLDKLLYHKGWGRKELSVIMGGAKKGKSMGLGHFALKASKAGYHVLYVTMEVASDIIADRMDANVSEVPMQEIEERITEVRDKVDLNKNAAGRGELRVIEFPSGTLTPGKLRRLLERYRADGINFDLIVPDYADIMQPDVYTKDPIENSKQIWLGLRAIAFEYDAAVLTATQTNRDGFKAETAKAEHAAEDFNKVRIADLLISINRTDEERDRGEARLYFAASRNQGGEFTIHIKQDLETMRFITGITSIT